MGFRKIIQLDFIVLRSLRNLSIRMKTLSVLRFQNFRLLNSVDDLWAHTHDLLLEPILNHLVLSLEDLELLV